MGRVHIDKLHRFPVTHFGGDNVEEARYRGDRLHGEQKDTRHTIIKLGDRCLEVLVAKTFQSRRISLKDHKNIINEGESISDSPDRISSGSIIKKMVDTREPKKPERIDSQIKRIFILASEENNINSNSVYVTYRFGDRHICFPEKIPNSEASPPTSCVVVDDVEKSENLGPADLMVVLDIINEGDNINSPKFSPEPILTDPHKMSRTIQRTSPRTNTIL